MSEQNLELARRTFAAFADRDPTALAAIMADDVAGRLCATHEEALEEGAAIVRRSAGEGDRWG